MPTLYTNRTGRTAGLCVPAPRSALGWDKLAAPARAGVAGGGSWAQGDQARQEAGPALLTRLSSLSAYHDFSREPKSVVFCGFAAPGHCPAWAPRLGSRGVLGVGVTALHPWAIEQGVAPGPSMRLLPSGVIRGGSPLWASVATRSFPCASPGCPAAGGHTPEAEKGLRKGPQVVVLSSGPRGQAWGASRRTDRPAGQTWAPGRRETRRRGPSPGPPREAWTAAEGAGRERRVSSMSEDALCRELVLGGR